MAVTLLPEVYLEIFSHLDQSAACKTARVCKLFSALVLDRLLRELRWYTEDAPTPVLKLISDRPDSNLGRHTRKLVVRLSPPRQWLYPGDGNANRFMTPQERQVQVELRNERFACSWRAVLTYAGLFTGLVELVIDGAPRQLNLLTLLPNFPKTLKHLKLRGCDLGAAPQNLLQTIGTSSSITRVTLDANTQATRGLSPLSPQPMTGMYHPFAFLGHLPVVKRLNLKLCADIGHSLNLGELRLPNLEELDLYVGLNAPQVNVIEEFVGHCTGLRYLRVVIRKGADLGMGKIKLTQLRHYDGPLTLVKSILPTNAVEHLAIPEDGYEKELEQGVEPTLHPLDEVFSTFQSYPSQIHGLRFFSFTMKEWDGAFLFSLLPMLPNLQGFKLVYRKDGPPEDYLVSLGAELLAIAVPQIESVQLYGQSKDGKDQERRDDPWYYEYINGDGQARHFIPTSPMTPMEVDQNDLVAVDNEEVHDILLGWTWRGLLPKLRMVQLHERSVFRRSGEGSRWYNS